MQCRDGAWLLTPQLAHCRPRLQNDIVGINVRLERHSQTLLSNQYRANLWGYTEVSLTQGQLLRPAARGVCGQRQRPTGLVLDPTRPSPLQLLIFAGTAVLNILTLRWMFSGKERHGRFEGLGGAFEL